MQDSAENDERVMTLVRAALLVPAVERAELLRVASEGAADLYSEAVRVVEWEERMGDFLRQPLINFIDLEASERPEPPFLPGESISHRFVILREVGRGGMGIVYEAFDRKRNQRIAIKCAQPGFGRLLSPELEGALKVRHPNICLVNEIHTTQTKFGELDFLTMEFLEGETLADRLARGGKLPPDEALQISRQLCAGLAAAHDNGILHRDLKAANVILNRREDGSLRAVITDFGLATEARLDNALDGGTPSYMAPELWRGEKPSRASDVYSLGVILYEMVTGQQPSAADGTAESSNPAPKLPSTLSKDLDPRWDKALLPCFDPAPAARPKADEVLAVFDKRPLWRSPAAAAAVLAVVALLAGFQQPLAKLFKPADIRLAILPLDAPADLQEMGNGVLQDVAERIKRSRRGSATLVVIPLSEALSNGVKNPQTAEKILHATHALQLKLHREQDHLVAQEAIVELANQTRVGAFSARYSEVTYGDITAALAAAASSSLRLQRTDVDTISAVATTAYDQGLYFLNRDNNSFDAAIPLFEEAARLDPHSPLPSARLAEALIQKFRATNDHRWIEQADQALAAAIALNPDSVPVLMASGRLEGTKGRPEKALPYFSRIQELEPHNVEVHLRMAAAYNSQDMLEAATESYRKAISLDPNYYKTYEEFGLFFYAHGQYAQAAEQFRNAIARAPGLYDAYTDLGAALSEMTQDEEAERVLTASLNIKETARALNSLGAIKAYQAKDVEAVQFYKRSLSINPTSFIYLMNLADSSRRIGQKTNATDFYRKGMKSALDRLNEDPRSGFTRAYVAYFAARLGEPARAASEIQQALQLSPADKTVLRRAVLTYEVLGKRDEALRIVARIPVQVLRELNRHPDLADLRSDSRFKDLVAKSQEGG